MWIGTGSGADVFGPNWSLRRPLRQARRHDQRRPRPERVPRRARTARLAGLEPRAHPLPAGIASGAGAAARTSSSPNVSAGDRPLDAALAGRPRPRERNFGVSWAGLTFIEPAEGPVPPPDDRPGRPIHGDGADRGALSRAPDRQVPLRGRSAFPRPARSPGCRPSSRSRSGRPGGRRCGRGPLGCSLAAGAARAGRALAHAAPRGRAPPPGGGRRGPQRRARGGQPGAARGVVHRRADRRAQPALLLDGHRGRRQPDAARPLDAAGRTARATAT